MNPFRFLLIYVAKRLIINDAPKVSDVIIVPSGNMENLRINHGVHIYKEKYAPKILLSGRISLQKETAINLGRIYAMSLGVPEQDLILEEDSNSTFENALFSKEIVLKNKFKSVLIITYPPHTRRTRRIFRKVFPENISILTCCCENDFDVNVWWKNRNMVRDIVYEYFCILWNCIFKS